MQDTSMGCEMMSRRNMEENMAVVVITVVSPFSLSAGCELEN